MIEFVEFTEFLGWSLVINFAVLMFATVALAFGRSLIVPIHTKILGISEPELLNLYALYLTNYKIGVILLNFSPYIALKLMGY